MLTVSDFTDIGLHIMSSGEEIALCYNIKTSSLNRKHEQYLFINDGYSNELLIGNRQIVNFKYTAILSRIAYSTMYRPLL